MKQKGLLVLLLILGLVMVAPTPMVAHTANANANDQLSATNEGLALAQFLDADGALNLPPRRYPG